MGYRNAARLAESVQLPEWDDAGVRQFAQDAKPRLFIATPFSTKLDDIAEAVFHRSPDDLAVLGFAVQSALSANTPSQFDSAGPAYTIAQALKNAERPVIITGTSLGSEPLVKAAANIAWELSTLGKQAAFMACVPESNSLGLALMDAGDLESAFKIMAEGGADTVVILENDLYRRAPADLVDRFLDRAAHVIVLDHLDTATVEKADLVFPVATFAEGSGTLICNEGRAQMFHAVFPPDKTVRESFRILAVMNPGAKEKLSADHVSETLLKDLALTRPVFAGLGTPHAPIPFPAPGGNIPRQSFGYSGRTAMTAHISVHEPKRPADRDALLAFSMEGYDGTPPSDLLTRYWAPG
jgi:NADH-quinone oxidoreductase subunit G